MTHSEHFSFFLLAIFLETMEYNIHNVSVNQVYLRSFHSSLLYCPVSRISLVISLSSPILPRNIPKIHTLERRKPNKFSPFSSLSRERVYLLAHCKRLWSETTPESCAQDFRFLSPSSDIKILFFCWFYVVVSLSLSQISLSSLYFFPFCVTPCRFIILLCLSAPTRFFTLILSEFYTISIITCEHWNHSTNVSSGFASLSLGFHSIQKPEYSGSHNLFLQNITVECKLTDQDWRELNVSTNRPNDNDSNWLFCRQDHPCGDRSRSCRKYVRAR